MENKKLNSVVKYLIDDSRFRVSLPLFQKKIYIPEEIMENLGIKINPQTLPVKLNLPKRLKSINGNLFPCKGWVYQIDNYYKNINAPLELLDPAYGLRVSASNHQIFIGYSELALFNLKRWLKCYKSSLTLYEATIPSFSRFAKNRAVLIEQADLITKSVKITKVIYIDYTKRSGFTEVI